MLNMLRMDLRRMFRSRMFYIAFLCLTAGILIMIIMLHTITDPELREQAIDAGMKFTTTNDSDFDEIRQMSETEASVPLFTAVDFSSLRFMLWRFCLSVLISAAALPKTFFPIMEDDGVISPAK